MHVDELKNCSFHALRFSQYLLTSDKDPFCAVHYRVTIVLSDTKTSYKQGGDRIDRDIFRCCKNVKCANTSVKLDCIENSTSKWKYMVTVFCLKVEELNEKSIQ